MPRENHCVPGASVLFNYFFYHINILRFTVFVLLFYLFSTDT